MKSENTGLIRARDFAARWKFKITRVGNYINILTMFLLLPVFAQTLYSWDVIRNAMTLMQLVILVYVVGVVLVLAIAEADWRFMFRREYGYSTSKYPLAVTDVFRTAKMLNELKKEGKNISKIQKKIEEIYKETDMLDLFHEFLIATR